MLNSEFHTFHLWIMEVFITLGQTTEKPHDPSDPTFFHLPLSLSSTIQENVFDFFSSPKSDISLWEFRALELREKPGLYVIMNK